MYGSAGTSIGGATQGTGPVSQRPWWFNPHPIQKYATG